MLTVFLVTILAGILAYLYLKMKEKFRYWEKRGVPFVKPKLILGSTPFPPKKTFGEFLIDVYNQFPNEKKAGYFQILQPILVVRDPELIERVLVKDFGSFTDHGFNLDEDTNPLEVSLITMNGNKWRAMRNKVTPIFTTGKLRGMVPLMAEAFQSTVDQCCDIQEMEIRDFFATYATIVNGSCVFGIETKEISKNDSEFRRMNRQMFEMSKIQFIKMTLLSVFPKLAKKLGIGFQTQESLKFFEKIVVQTLERRRNDPSLKRNDLIQTLLQLRDKGSIELYTKDPDDDYLKTEDNQTVESFEMTDTMLVSQALSFLINGFEGPSLVMMYCCMELAKNPELQEKLRAEVDEKIKANQGKLDYDTIKSMTYLDQCLQETLRMYPIAQMLVRVATKPTVLDGVSMRPGDMVFVPAMALHFDPAYFPDPTVFNPERFAPGQTITPFTYLPFGDGPRMCIGFRFTMLEMKIGVAMAVRNFNIRLSPKTKFPLDYSPYNFMLTPKQKILLQMTKLTI